VAPPPDDELEATTVEVEDAVVASVDSSLSLQATRAARTQTIPNRFFDILFYLCSPKVGGLGSILYHRAKSLHGFVWKRSVNDHVVARLYAEKIPNDLLGLVGVERFAGEYIHGETLSDRPAVDGHVGRRDDTHACDSTFILEHVGLKFRWV
jgi:hypothetical protein